MCDAFDKAAPNWDANPVRAAMADAFSREIRRLVAIHDDWDALEFGCGTGLAGLKLAPLTASLTMADASEAMLTKLRDKLSESEYDNVRLLHVKNGSLPFPDDSFDLVFTHMALHHVDDVEGMLKEFMRTLRPGGYAVACDLVAEDGSFHGDIPAPHNGFNLGELQGLFSRVGFAASETRLHHAVRKPGPDGEVRRYPQFILAARKS